MADTPQRPQPPLSPNDALPPVEPPSAGFIVQLFVIPAVIVAIIIIVWATFNWLAHMGSDPRAHVEALKRNNEGRWQEAVNLANELNRTGNEALRRDEAMLRELTTLLDSEMTAASMEDKDVSFRMYLCRTIGEFYQPAALPPLVKAVETNRAPSERDVRLGALQALARLLPNITKDKPENDPNLRRALEAASRDEDPVVRYHAAYDFGVLGDQASQDRLEVMLNDANVDVRMNAATGLARHGNAACVEELAKMLDPAETAGLDAEQEPEAREAKRFTMFANALEAVKQFAAKNPKADVKPLLAGLDKLLASNPPANIRLAAEDVRRDLQKRGS